MREIILIVCSYLLGCVPFGIMLAGLWRGIDIRQYGSRNIGATNVLRTVGPGAAAAVFSADVLKGLIPVLLAKYLFPEVAWIAVVCGMAAILGHSVSIFLGFHGGKGAATGLGVIIGLEPRVAGIAFGLWVLVVVVTRYVSAASIIASASIPILMWGLDAPLEYKLFSAAAAAFVIAKHRANIARLARGKELRFGNKAAPNHSGTEGGDMVKGTKGDPLVALARETVEDYIRFGRIRPTPAPIPPELEMRAGAFVSLKKHGQLRGCIGTVEPSQPNLAAEIIQNAVSAAVRDPRFEPVTTDELGDLEITVDVLSPPQQVLSLAELDPKQYGVIVESGSKKGLLLPDLDGIEGVEDQVSIARRKAGIFDDEPLTLYRFEVRRHGG